MLQMCRIWGISAAEVKLSTEGFMEKEDVITIIENVPYFDDVTHRGDFLNRSMEYTLAINGRPINSEDVEVKSHSDPIISLKNKRVAYVSPQRTYKIIPKKPIFKDKLLGYKPKSFPSNVHEVSFNIIDSYTVTNEPLFLSILFTLEKSLIFKFIILVDPYIWNRYYSIADFMEVLRSVGEVEYTGYSIEQVMGLARDDKGIMQILMFFPYTANDENCCSILEKLSDICRLIYHKTILTFTENKNSVEITLDLPPDIRIACEQYLLYFVQFLKDLGVNATSELKHEGSKVLFSVTPEDKDQALDKIRAALEVYLSLPSGKLTNTSDSMEIQRLSININHLQGQLMIAQAVLQAKEATIEAQQMTIHQQKFLLAENVITQSIVDITPEKDKDDKEELLGGTVALTTYKDYGVEVNLAELYRKMKGWFDKK